MQAKLVTLSVVCLFGLSAMASPTALQADDAEPWYYRPGADIRPIARSIDLTDEVPDEFERSFQLVGAQPSFAQLRYGSENSRRVVLMVHRQDEGGFDLYADRNRDRVMTRDELVVGQGRERLLRLDTETILEDQPEQASREILLRLSITGQRLSIATLGCIEGQVRLEQQDGEAAQVAVRRIDGDANGLFADARDRLMIDLNGDGQWDPIRESFAQLPILTLLGGRYGVRSDRLGKSFSLVPIQGTGQVRLALDRLPEDARVRSLEAMLFSDDGSAYAIREMGSALTVPVGRYTLGSITLTIDTGTDELWHFVFSRSSSIPESAWQTVEAEAELVLEAVGDPRFELGAEPHAQVLAGEAVRFSPTMLTEAGLLINLSSRGKQIGSWDRPRLHNNCQVSIVDANQRPISSAQSGFA